MKKRNLLIAVFAVSVVVYLLFIHFEDRPKNEIVDIGVNRFLITPERNSSCFIIDAHNETYLVADQLSGGLCESVDTESDAVIFTKVCLVCNPYLPPRRIDTFIE